MDAFITLLAENGGIGMFIAAFLAGSFFPFSSEAVMLALLAAVPIQVNYWFGAQQAMCWAACLIMG